MSKERVLQCFEICSHGSTYPETIGNAGLTLAYIVDAAERVAQTKKKRVEFTLQTDTLTKPYRVICEEIEKLNPEPEKEETNDLGM